MINDDLKAIGLIIVDELLFLTKAKRDDYSILSRLKFGFGSGSLPVACLPHGRGVELAMEAMNPSWILASKGKGVGGKDPYSGQERGHGGGHGGFAGPIIIIFKKT